MDIIALGGGGFARGSRRLLLDRYILAQARAKRPRVLFIPTAGGDDARYIGRFERAYRRLRCRPSVLSLFRGPFGDLRRLILSQDVVYVGGGNTKNMLALWRVWGVDRYLREAWRRGTVMAGVSAGMICWFEQGVTDSVPGKLTPLTCMGWLPGSACPHYDSETMRRPTYRRLVATRTVQPGWAADDAVALHFRGRKLHAIVSPKRKARAWRLERRGGRAIEVEVRPTRLS